MNSLHSPFAVRNKPQTNRWEGTILLILTLTLLFLGLAFVYSASAMLARAKKLPDYHFMIQQVEGAAIGLFGMVVLSRLDYRRLATLAWPGLFVVVGMLLLVILPGTHGIAPVINGARRWLTLGPINFQPSELAKLVLIIWTAAMAVRKQERFASLTRGLLPFLIIWLLVEGLVFLQPNMSTGLLILLLSVLVAFAAGARPGHFVLLGILSLPILWSKIEGEAYRLRRISAFLNPTEDPTGESYQITQALIAIGSGGLLGRGFGSGQQKFGFLPEPHNDFVFSLIAEEWGFLGSVALILLYLAFAIVGYRIARRAPDLFGFLLAFGLTNLIVIQAFLHMAINVALLPTTGVTLPFISYGRSSLLVSLAAVGILVNIAKAGRPEGT